MIIVKIISTPFKQDFIFSSSSYLATGMMDIGRINRPHIWRPPTDVFECENEIVVRVEIAGMEESDFTITIDQNYLLIQGVRNDSSTRLAYHQMEIRFGEFSTFVELPDSVIINEARAEYEKGFLQVILPKNNPSRLHIKK